MNPLIDTAEDWQEFEFLVESELDDMVAHGAQPWAMERVHSWLA